jgi:hypothetical protein
LFPSMEAEPDDGSGASRLYRLPAGMPRLPLAVSLRAVRTG